MIKSGLKTRKRRKYKNHFYINLYLKDSLGMEFTAFEGELIPEGALTSLTVCDAYRYMTGRA